MVFQGRQASNRTAHEPGATDRADAGIRYRMLQNPASATDDVLVQTDEGRVAFRRGVWSCLGVVAFRIEGSSGHPMDMTSILDMDGTVHCRIARPRTASAGSAEVLGRDGTRMARVIRMPLTAARDRFEVDIAHNDFWAAIGDVGNREFTLESPAGRVAEISRRWFLRPGSFGVEVSAGYDDALVLAVTALIEDLAHDLTG